MGSRSFNIGTLRLLCGLVDMDSVDDMCDEIRMMMVNWGPVSIIGSGGNINKLYRLVPKKVRRDNRLSLTQLEQLYDKLSSLSFEERMKQFDLRSSRADVIVPAAQIFISIARAVKATEIIVPTIGLADGIIKELCTKIQAGGGSVGKLVKTQSAISAMYLRKSNRPPAFSIGSPLTRQSHKWEK